MSHTKGTKDMSAQLSHTRSVLKDWGASKGGIVHFLVCGRCFNLPLGDYQYICSDGHISCTDCELESCGYDPKKTGLPCRRSLSKVRVTIAQKKLTEALQQEIRALESNKPVVGDEIAAKLVAGAIRSDAPEKIVASVEVAATPEELVAGIGANPEELVAGAEIGTTLEELVAGAEIGANPEELVAGAEIGTTPEELVAGADIGAKPEELVAGAEIGVTPEKTVADAEVAATPEELVTGAEIAATPEKLETSVEGPAPVESIPEQPTKQDGPNQILVRMIGKEMLIQIQNKVKQSYPNDTKAQKRALLVLVKEKVASTSTLKKEKEVAEKKMV